MSEQWDEKNVGHFFVLDLVSPAVFQKLFKSQHFNKNNYAMSVCLIILHGQLSSMTCRFQTRHFLCVLVRNSFSAFSSTNFFPQECVWQILKLFLLAIDCFFGYHQLFILSQWSNHILRAAAPFCTIQKNLGNLFLVSQPFCVAD